MTDPLGPPLGRLSVIGTPYHGLVRAGQLTLPNAQVIDYPQPDGSNTFLLDLGAPAVARSTEQQAWDAERGFQWRNVATLSGRTYQYAGHDLQGWVWADANGDRWLVSTSLDGTFGSIKPGVSGTVTFRPFGRMGYGVEPDDPVQVNVEVTDSGQDTPTDINRTGGDIPSAVRQVVDIRPDGGAAIIMLGVEEPIHDGAGRLVRLVSLGFLELTLSGVAGSLDAQLSVLRTREQTLGTQSHSITSTGALYDWDHGSNTSVQNLGNGTSRHTTTFYNNGMVAGSGWVMGELTETHSVTGRIVAMIYDDGVPAEITLDSELEETWTGGVVDVHAGEYVRIVDSNSGEVLMVESDTRETLFEHTQTSGAQKTHTLTGPGGSVSVTAVEDRSALAYQYIDYDGQSVDEDAGRTSTFTSEMPGIQGAAGCDDGVTEFVYWRIRASVGPLTQAFAYGDFNSNRYLAPLFSYLLNCQGEWFWSGMAWACSNKVHCLAMVSRNHPTGRAVIAGHITPDGADGTVQDFESMVHREFASWDPVTGAVAWLDREADPEDAVCFV